METLKIFTFSRAIREGKLQTEVHTFSSKTLQVAKVAPLELFSLQNDTSRTFSYVSDVFGCSESPKTRLGAQNAFWSNKCTLGPKDRARGRCCIDEKLGSPNSANFLLQSAPWEHLGHFGSQWSPGLAGWLLGAQSRGLRAHG